MTTSYPTMFLPIESANKLSSTISPTFIWAFGRSDSNDMLPVVIVRLVVGAVVGITAVLSDGKSVFEFSVSSTLTVLIFSLGIFVLLDINKNNPVPINTAKKTTNKYLNILFFSASFSILYKLYKLYNFINSLILHRS